MTEKFKTGLAVFGLTVLALIVVELLARGVIFVSDEWLNIGRTEDLAHAAAYQDADYDVVQLFKELDKNRTDTVYKSYIVWGLPPFTGTLVNVDQSGNRVTGYNSSQGDALQVWMLGGSTMWGYGAPDGQTIASHLARFLNQTWGVDAQVRNLGQLGYVSTQEVVYLLRELQAGKRPDVVIFYDGFNDAITAQRFPEEPGGHFNLDVIRDRYEKILVPLLRSTGSARLVASLIGHIRIDTAGLTKELDTYQLAEQAANVLLENYTMVVALGEAYGFIPVFVFQPALGVGGKPYDLAEQAMFPANRAKTIVMSDMPTIIRDRLHKEDHLRIHDITDVFKDTNGPVYIDAVHVTGEGNRIVGTRIFEILRNELCHDMPAHVSDRAKTQLTSACRI